MVADGATDDNGDVDGYDATSYGDRWADVYDSWYPPDTDVAACVDAIDALAGPPGASVVLELGVGTGRVALPLAGRGHDVRGIDASAAMLRRLAAKDPDGSVAVAVGDMADLGPSMVPRRAGEVTAPGRVGIVYATYNTFFALPTASAQQQALRGVADVLEAGGALAVECFVPEPDALGRTDTVAVRSMGVDHLVLTADRVDAVRQTVSGHFVEFGDDRVRLRPFHLRYLSPHQLDDLAASAGLSLSTRAADWAGSPFGPEADRHVSVYRHG